MAPQRSSLDGSAEPPADYDEFFEKLQIFHEQRGTTMDPAARVNGKHIDLYKLFHVVSYRGGYDTVCSEKLAWRKVGQDFNLGQTNTAAYAFALKTVYYKNLAAYELKTVHNIDPPPPEILENISAKGGDLKTRTIENFKPPQAKEQISEQNSEVSGDEGRTPKEEKMEMDDPGSGGGRTTRGLRQAPPQRVLFQPDITSSRQSRHVSNHLQQSPQPPNVPNSSSYNYNPSSNPNSMSFSIANYEPRPQMPLTLRPVTTPGNNPVMFKERLRLVKEAAAARLGKTSPSYKGMMLPGTGFEGPNIYVRTLNALRSGVAEEQDYALHHLVKISHERGDKYKFEAFPGLAEGLIEKLLEITDLFYGFKWEITYVNDGIDQDNVLDGVNGSTEMLSRIQSLHKLDVPDEMETEEFSDNLTKIIEAGLVIRNMTMLEDNAEYLSKQHPVRDLLSILLSLPDIPAVTELRHYALDIAEQLTKYWSLDYSDPLYRLLLEQLSGSDRGAILTTLRAISRISMNLDESNRLKGVTLHTIRSICEWTLLDDEELVGACLDFFYQFTAVPENVAFLLTSFQDGSLALDSLLKNLGRLLLYRADERTERRVLSPAVPANSATEIPPVPVDLLEQLMTFDESDRSSHWLRACFEEDPSSDITQIALWQAYQQCFTELSTPQKPMLAAAEFIKNVSTTFTGANAQVISGPNPKFIIKGIRYRHLPMDLKRRVYTRCLWKPPASPTICGEFQLNSRNMYEHIVNSHLRIPRVECQYDFTAAKTAYALQDRKFHCHWAGCRHFAPTHGTSNPYEAGMHIKTHLSDTTEMAPARASHNVSAPTTGAIGNKAVVNGHVEPRDDGIPDDRNLNGRPATYSYKSWFVTATDERGDAMGLPLTSVLVLRNLARNISKAVIVLDTDNLGGGAMLTTAEWMDRLFGPLRGNLWYVMAHNRPLVGYVGDLMSAVEKGISG